MPRTERKAPLPQELLPRLRRHPAFAEVPEEDLRRLAGRLREVCYPRGSPILGPQEVPDRLRFVVEGAVEARGEGGVAVELVEGEGFPLEALVEHRASGLSWRARTDVWCLEVPVEEFARLHERSEGFRAFCRSRLDAFRAAGSLRPGPEPEDPGLARALGGLMQPDPPLCRPADPIRSALHAMDRRNATVVVVTDDGGRPVGLVTLRDVLRRVALPGRDTSEPVEGVMTPDPLTLPPDAFGFEAALVMAERGFHHLPVVDGGRVVGLVSESDLFRSNRLRLADLGNRIRAADEVAGLARLAREIKALAHRLLAAGTAAEQVTRLVSTLNDHLTTRVLELELAPALPRGVRVCWIALGSEGRMEQTLSTDQDNGLVFAAGGREAGAVRAELLPAARRANEALAACGFPLCKGGVMASNPAWCLDREEWKDRFRSWLGSPGPEALLNATIFFDLRPLFGDTGLGLELREWLRHEAPRSDLFLHHLAANALGRTPPLGFFRDFVVETRGEHKGTLDLKTHGVAVFTDAARVLGLAHACPTSNTAERLRAAAGPMRLDPAQVEAWIDAHLFLQRLRLRHQYEQERSGVEPDNRIRPDDLNPLDRRFLLEAFRQAKRLQRRLAMEYQVGGGGL